MFQVECQKWQKIGNDIVMVGDRKPLPTKYETLEEVRKDAVCLDQNFGEWGWKSWIVEVNDADTAPV